MRVGVGWLVVGVGEGGGGSHSISDPVENPTSSGVGLQEGALTDLSR